MSSYSGDAAEQVVRMSLEGAEVAVKLAGTGAKHLAILLYSILKDQKRTKGKIRLTNMLRSGKELRVFAVKDDELQKFCAESKKYGVLYTVLKDRDATDGYTDVMVRAEDASKINRIFERFNLTTVDQGSVRAEIARALEEKKEVSNALKKPMTEQEKKEEFIEQLFRDPEESGPNPTLGRTAVSPQSVPSSGTRSITGRNDSDERLPESRPSVRKELDDIRKELNNQNASKDKEIQRSPQHKAPKKKRKKEKTR
nr:PcfB family protein [Lachnospiraceae bacterium]